MQVSFTPEFADRLRADMGLAGQTGHNPHGGGNTYELERALGEDLLLTSVGWANCYYQSKEPYTDEWGIGWKSCEYTTPFGKGFYTEIAGHPLSDANAISTYRPPDPNRPELYADAAHLIPNYKQDYFIVGVTVTSTIFETAWALRGLETMLMDLVADPDLAKAILDIPYRYHLTAAKKLVEMGVDAIWVGDDIGAQQTLAVWLARCARGQLVGFGYYDVEDLEVARARFEELRRTPAPPSVRDPLAIPPNTAVRVWDRWYAAVLAGEDVRGVYTDDSYRSEDRRPLLRGTYGLDSAVSFAQWVRDGGRRATRTLLATTGDRLALLHVVWRSSASGADSEIEWLELEETSADGFSAAAVLFDSSDRAAAHEEMFQRNLRLGGQASWQRLLPAFSISEMK